MIVTTFDFDDSLFSSYDFSQKKSISNPSKLSKRISKLLNMALFFSDKVYIITNAEKEWVRLVMEEYLPECAKLYALIETISIPDNGYNRGLEFPQWKTAGFGITLSRHFYDSFFDKNTTSHHLISIGDSPYDHMAAESIGELFPNIFLKIVRLKQCPTEAEVVLQLKILREGMKFIAEHQGDLDINLKISGSIKYGTVITKLPLETIEEVDEKSESEEAEEDEKYIPVYEPEFPVVKIC